MKQRICDFILKWTELNLTTGCTITDLESLTGYSGKTLQRWFREKYGMTPAEYLYRSRMTRAAILLRMTSLPVTEVAEIFHYYSSQNFSRAFVQFSGLTPSEYRDHSEWFCEALQPSLFIDKARYTNWSVCELPHLCIKGKEILYTDYILNSSMNNKIFSFIKNTVKEFGNNGKNDVHLAGIANKPSNLSIGRKDSIEVNLYTGRLVEPEKPHNVDIPGGCFIRWEFSGTWNDYIFFSKSAGLMLTHGTTMRRRVGYDYIHFHPAPDSEPQTEVICDMYIPVTI